MQTFTRHIYTYIYRERENNAWVPGNVTFTSRVEQDILRVTFFGHVPFGVLGVGSVKYSQNKAATVNQGTI